MAEIEGSCLCGAVRFSAPEEPVLTAFCHCRNCQKGSGGAYSANVAVPEASFKLEGAVSRYSWTGGSGANLKRSFCPGCGSPIAIEAEAFPGLILLQAGGFHDSSWIEPNLHIWCASAQPWDQIPEEATRFAGAPAQTG